MHQCETNRGKVLGLHAKLLGGVAQRRVKAKQPGKLSVIVDVGRCRIPFLVVERRVCSEDVLPGAVLKELHEVVHLLGCVLVWCSANNKGDSESRATSDQEALVNKPGRIGADDDIGVGLNQGCEREVPVVSCWGGDQGTVLFK